MKLLVCGTAAAESWPAVFCVCDVCAGARKRGGKDIRSRSAYMLGDRIRVDFGPDSNYHQHRYGLDLGKLEHLLVTHSHDDHWVPMDLTYRRKGFSVVPDRALHVWGNGSVRRTFETYHGGDWDRYFLEFHQIQPWQPIELVDSISATPVLAAHDRSEECVNYRIEVDGHAGLLGHDTGWYDEPAWEFLSGKPLDLLLLDCTYGSQESCQGHMGCSWVVRARDEFAKRGALAPDAHVVATHFSHNGGWLHEELERYLNPHDISVAFDGMELSL